VISQANISPNTPMGANLVSGGGATFRVWAPLASAVYINGIFNGTTTTGQADKLLFEKDRNGYWTGFVAEAKEGDPYHFWVEGPGGSGYKRDPYARELAPASAFPDCNCLIRSAAGYPWHDSAFVIPDFSNMIIYQLHIGTFNPSVPGAASTFLDVLAKIPYLVALGVNVLQPLPVDEVETDPSMGYDGADLFSPDFPYVVTDSARLKLYLGTTNRLLAAKGFGPIGLADIMSGPAQLKTLIDLCHVYGIAVALDVVYNHAGGFTVKGQLDDNCIYYWDRAKNLGNNNDSLYFTDQDRGTGGLSFALWKNDVCQFLINNALYYIEEFHADGFRYDEISSLISMNCDSGWTFCRSLTDTLRYVKPRLLQNAEFWPGEVGNYPKSLTSILTSTNDGGAGFDVVQHDGLRGAIRGAIRAASYGRNSSVDIRAIADNLYPQGLRYGWQSVPCVENHDIVKAGAEPRLPALADGADHRSWYARSRPRFAMGLLLTAPGIPQVFMGQEILEDKQWSSDPKASNLIWWAGVDSGADPAMVNQLRFTQDLIRLRWSYPALRGDNVNAFYCDNHDRVIAFHRWLETGEDVIVAATLSENTWYDYAIGFPFAGSWREVFNSDVYDNWVNPVVAGNGGATAAFGPPLHGFSASANIVIPANGIVVFARA